MWPPSRSPTARARSRLTVVPGRQDPIVVRESVSGTASKETRPPPRSATVRQQPEHATLSPSTRASTSRVRGRSVRRAPPCRGATRSTVPTSEMRPVNMSGRILAVVREICQDVPRSSARSGGPHPPPSRGAGRPRLAPPLGCARGPPGHDQVLSHPPHLDPLQEERVCHPVWAFGVKPFLPAPEQLGRDVEHQPVDAPGCEEGFVHLGAALDEDVGDASRSELAE